MFKSPSIHCEEQAFKHLLQYLIDDDLLNFLFKGCVTLGTFFASFLLGRHLKDDKHVPFVNSKQKIAGFAVSKHFTSKARILR